MVLRIKARTLRLSRQAVYIQLYHILPLALIFEDDTLMKYFSLKKKAGGGYLLGMAGHTCNPALRRYETDKFKISQVYTENSKLVRVT